MNSDQIILAKSTWSVLPDFGILGVKLIFKTKFKSMGFRVVIFLESNVSKSEFFQNFVQKFPKYSGRPKVCHNAMITVESHEMLCK